MIIKKIFGFVFAITVLLGCCSGKIYKVGGSDGWNAKKNSWAEHKEFQVGDSLILEYDQNINDVTQVSSALEYVSCDSSSPKAVYNTGHDVVTLKEPGYHYFISSNHIQCVNGLKLDVLVVHDKSRLIPPPPASNKIHDPAHPIPPPPPPSKIHEPSRPITPPPPPPSKIHEPSRPITTPPPPPPSKVLPFGKIYKVGDSRGWSVYNSFYYYKWSEAKQFHVGDTLFFQYNKDLNDVSEITDDLDFKSCEPNSTVAIYKTGHDLIKLTKPGMHYFVSLKTGLCQAGIKLRVTVQPSTEAVTFPNVPKKKLSPIDRFNRWWSHPFRPHH
ncbi:Phytocyanin domain [Arabidopsis suecica]|uniref:Phytocyanin domain n=1 Tax=Arabidopsis suecica TaxID=45249 RepID=A0A8T1ZZU2_ARASU|nr:Phytocyanin domain [Arabidopsis suecica]